MKGEAAKRESASGARSVACPACGGRIVARATGYAVTLGCAHCGSALDATRPEVELIARHKRAVAKFPLALGKRGYLFDQYWDVIGALKRKDALDMWNEYLLFNPYVGYRWLVEYKGDWQFGTMVLDVPEADADGIVWRGERFTSAGPDQQVTATCVIGEFYWRIKAGDQVRCVSFERGDVSLSCEVTDEEVNWTQLVPIAAREVQTAFAIDGRKMPGRRFAQQAHAAAGAADDLLAMFAVAGIGAFLALVVMLLLAGPVSRTVGSVNAPYGKTREGVLIGTLEIKRDWQLVSLRAQGQDFDNRWVDIDYSLVDRRTGQAIGGYGLAERYSGVDSDGSWVEGSRGAETLLGHVPRGTYDLYVDAEAHAWPIDATLNPDGSVSMPTDGSQLSTWAQPDAITMTIVAETGALPSGNWWTVLVLLLAWPMAILWWRHEND